MKQKRIYFFANYLYISIQIWLKPVWEVKMAALLRFHSFLFFSQISQDLWILCIKISRKYFIFIALNSIKKKSVNLYLGRISFIFRKGDQLRTNKTYLGSDLEGHSLHADVIKKVYIYYNRLNIKDLDIHDVCMSSPKS